MKYIHPFPARMAPEIVLSEIKSLSSKEKILDPMCGSGVVLSQAAKHGIQSFGYDIDPLAVLISKVNGTKIDEDEIQDNLQILLEKCNYALNKNINVPLDWIDKDEETSKFIDFWFYPPQKQQLRILSFYLSSLSISDKCKDIIKVAISRLIITKEPKASLARDTAHSRPHRTITENNFDIFSELPKSLNLVIKALNNSEIKNNTKVYLGDSRTMTEIDSNSVDLIITSPPYFNAIDYIRGSKLSLVWFGYTISQLKKIRGSCIGFEKQRNPSFNNIFKEQINTLDLTDLDSKQLIALNNYFISLKMQLSESFRVLKGNSRAIYVIGNSNIKGKYIKSNELLKTIATHIGFKLIDEITREIPNHSRYLPINFKKDNSLNSRMKTENIIFLEKL